MGLLGRFFGGGKKAETGGVTLQYTSGPGDTCRGLAKKFYGDESQWERIYELNKRLIENEVQSGTDALMVGTGLTIKDAKFDTEGKPLTSS